MERRRESVRIWLIGRRWWTACACLCLAAVMFYVVNYPAAVGASASARQLPIYCVQRDQKLVAISFDAAWGDVILRHILFDEKYPPVFAFQVYTIAMKHPKSNRLRVLSLY